MRDSSPGWFQQQVRFLRRQFLQDGELPFTDVLSEEIVAQALTAIAVYWMDRIYPPLVTLWVFLSQVLSADHSCRAAVARLIAHRVSHGQGPCSPDTGAYCQARKRLPEKFFSTVACQTGRALAPFEKLLSCETGFSCTNPPLGRAATVVSINCRCGGKHQGQSREAKDGTFDGGTV